MSHLQWKGLTSDNDQLPKKCHQQYTSSTIHILLHLRLFTNRLSEAEVLQKRKFRIKKTEPEVVKKDREM